MRRKGITREARARGRGTSFEKRDGADTAKVHKITRFTKSFGLQGAPWFEHETY